MTHPRAGLRRSYLERHAAGRARAPAVGGHFRYAVGRHRIEPARPPGELSGRCNSCSCHGWMAQPRDVGGGRIAADNPELARPNRSAVELNGGTRVPSRPAAYPDPPRCARLCVQLWRTR